MGLHVGDLSLDITIILGSHFGLCNRSHWRALGRGLLHSTVVLTLFAANWPTIGPYSRHIYNSTINRVMFSNGIPISARRAIFIRLEHPSLLDWMIGRTKVSKREDPFCVGLDWYP